MQSLLYSYVATTLCLSAIAANAHAQSDNSNALNAVDIMTVIGTKMNANDISGSVVFIGPEELAKQSYTDINRVLLTVPGVNIQEEDGYGLRPNIGMRGSGGERSNKIVIMEDGVLMAPAPYSSPAAYYFPMTARMNAVEITKGPATVGYGPNTTAGAIHFFSTPIPDEASAKIRLFVSDQNRVQAHAWAGTRFDAGAFDVGVLLETYQDRAEGFKKIARGNTGFDIGDYVGKLGLYTKDGRHSLEFKYQRKNEISDETYLGLSDADFALTPYTRYAASQLDQMDNVHEIFQLTHSFNLNDNWSVTTIVYRTEFARNWYKLQDLPGGRSGCTNLSTILTNTAACDQELAILQGEQNSVDDVLRIRANNRAYYAQGIQTALGGRINIGRVQHDLVISARLHKDQVDRFQYQNRYRMDGGALVLTRANAPGTQANRLSDASALALYVEDRMDFGRLGVTAGLRFETVDSQQTRWSGPGRDTLTISRERSNSYDVWLPALSAKYDLTDALSVLGGVHRGFAAPSVGSPDDVSPEESTVFEGGLRYLGGQGMKLEAIGFFNDYSNMLGDCTNFATCQGGDIGDSNNAGEVNVIGLEVSGSVDLADIWAAQNSIPVSVSYSYTDTEFQNSFESDFDAWGNVLVGDELPYVPKNQLTISAGYITDNWGVNTLVNFVSKTRTRAGQGNIAAGDLIDGRTIVDASAYYALTDSVKLRIKAENLLDKIYAAARFPAGLRPGKPREVFAGVEIKF